MKTLPEEIKNMLPLEINISNEDEFYFVGKYFVDRGFKFEYEFEYNNKPLLLVDRWRIFRNSVPQRASKYLSFKEFYDLVRDPVEIKKNIQYNNLCKAIKNLTI